MAEPRDFPTMRREAEETLQKVLAPQAHPDDQMAVVNTESQRAQALARLDCLCVQWLDQAFQEVDRVERWATLRADIIQRVTQRHSPVQMEDGVWACAECRTVYPCRTRQDLVTGTPPQQ